MCWGLGSPVLGTAPVPSFLAGVWLSCLPLPTRPMSFSVAACESHHVQKEKRKTKEKQLCSRSIITYFSEASTKCKHSQNKTLGAAGPLKRGQDGFKRNGSTQRVRVCLVRQKLVNPRAVQAGIWRTLLALSTTPQPPGALRSHGSSTQSPPIPIPTERAWASFLFLLPPVLPRDPGSQC